MKVIIENEKDQRIYDWLCKEIGKDAILTASKQLSGSRKPYISNIVKHLNLTVPFNILNSTEYGLNKLSEINQILSKKCKF